jgi:Peptidase family C25
MPVVMAQEVNSVRNIHWLPPVSGSSKNDKPVLRFRNAVYNDPIAGLPIYSELIPISYITENAKISIINPEFLPVDSLEKIILGAAKLDTLIKVKSETATSRGQRFLQVSFIPIRRNPISGEFERLIRFGFSVSNLSPNLKSTGIMRRAYAPHSLLSSGKWLKVKVDNTGIYKLSYNQLKTLGFSNPQNIRIYGNGGAMLPIENSVPRIDDLAEIPLRFIEATAGKFTSGDFVLFYVPGIVSWTYNQTDNFYYHSLHKFSNFAYCFITESLGPSDEIPVRPGSSSTPDHDITTFDDYAEHEIDAVNLIHSGSEWYGELFDLNNSYDFTFNFPNLSLIDSVKLYVRLVGRYSDNTTFSLQLNNQALPDVFINGVSLFDETDDYASIGILQAGTKVNSENLDLNIVYNNSGLQASQGWLDFIDINVRRSLQMNGDALTFRNSKMIGSGRIGRYLINNMSTGMAVWDVTDMHHPFEVQLSGVGQQAQFAAPTDSLHEYIAFNPQGNFPSPISTGPDVGWLSENQDLHSLEGADLVIVTHPLFVKQAQELAQLHQTMDHMNVIVATTSQVYNEFSSGAQDVSAVRDFMKMIYDRGKSSGHLPSYLMLVGDGSFDNKSDIATTGNADYILTYESPNSLTQNISFVSDDFYGLLDDDEGGYTGLLDIGVGRLPVQDTMHASAIVQKIKKYLDPGNRKDWRNVVTFIGDDGDDNLHMGQADQLATYIEFNYSGFAIEKIYLDAYQEVASPTGASYPGVESAIQQRIQNGALIINYTGHGNEIGLSHEKILQDNTIQNLDNQEKLPLFVTATCEFSRFDDMKTISNSRYGDATSAGEHLLLNPNGGGIALLSTTRLVYSGPNFTLNEQFYQFAFEQDNLGHRYKLGDLLRLTKNASGPGTNKLNFTLLGDPALALAYPEFTITTDSINHKAIAHFGDTLKAYSLINIKGHLADSTGKLISGFNGSVFPVVYDKAAHITTLNNDGTGAFYFQTYNSILFRGQATVTNGYFSFSFIVPKDINYSIGPGKIVYYANSSIGDAHGFLEGVNIGGILNNPPSDEQGPSLQLFMNDTGFVNGGITNENPFLLALISDTNGINTTGTGIGHDITLSLDGADKIYANDYYQTISDSYSRGSLKYPFSQLSPGPHIIDVKVWDSYNNSSEGSINFVVVLSNQLVISDLINFPNPFNSETRFEFKHNRPNENLTVTINIYSTSGQLERSLGTILNTDGFGSPSISWDGTDFNGQLLGRGIYIYRVSVSTQNGEITQKSGKLMLVR